MDRRQFLRGGVIAGLTFAVAAAAKAFALPLASTTTDDGLQARGGASGSTGPTGATGTEPRAPGSVGGRTITTLDRLPVGKAIGFTAPGVGAAVLVRLANDQVVAYSRTCTHAGCLVGYDPSNRILFCPCHGAEFDPARGARRSPARRRPRCRRSRSRSIPRPGRCSCRPEASVRRRTPSISAFVSCEVYGPRPEAQAEPARAASLIASGISNPAASAYASVAAKLSPAPYASAGVSGSSSSGEGGALPSPALSVALPGSAGESGGAHEQRRGARDRARVERLRLVSRAADQDVGGDPRRGERLERAAGHDQQACLPRRGEGLGVARRHVRDVGAVEPVPRKGVRTARLQAFAERHDRSLVAVIDQRHGSPGLVVADRRVDRQSERRQPSLAQLADVVVADRREQVARAGELRELHGGHGAPAGGLVPRLGRVHDLAGPGHPVDQPERDPFHVSHHRHAHPAQSCQVDGPSSRKLARCKRTCDSPRSATAQGARASWVPAISARSWGCSDRWRCPTRSSSPRRPGTTRRRGASGTDAR